MVTTVAFHGVGTLVSRLNGASGFEGRAHVVSCDGIGEGGMVRPRTKVRAK